MLQGEDRTFRIQVKGDSAFTLDSADCALTLIQPDDSPYTPDPAITVNPTSADVLHEVTFPVSLAQAGPYNARLQVHVAPQDVTVFEQDYFAGWTDVVSRVRLRLDNKTPAQLPDSLVDPFISLAVRRLQANHSDFEYRLITGYENRRMADEGIAILAALLLRTSPSLLRDVNGPVSKVKQGPVELTLASTFSAAKDIMEAWLDEAWDYLRKIPGLDDSVDMAAMRVFVAVGPRRAMDRAGVGHSNPLFQWLEFRQAAPLWP